MTWRVKEANAKVEVLKSREGHLQHSKEIMLLVRREVMKTHDVTHSEGDLHSRSIGSIETSSGSSGSQAASSAPESVNEASSSPECQPSDLSEPHAEPPCSEENQAMHLQDM